MTTSEIIQQLATGKRAGISDQVADPAALLDEIVRAWLRINGRLIINTIIDREINRIAAFETELDNAAPTISDDVHLTDDYARDAIVEIQAQKNFDTWIGEQEEKRRAERDYKNQPNQTGD